MYPIYTDIVIMYLRIHSIIMYLLRIDNMATSGYSSLILTPITETFILFIHSAMGTSGYLHDLFITPSPLSCYIYLSTLS